MRKPSSDLGSVQCFGRGSPLVSSLVSVDANFAKRRDWFCSYVLKEESPTVAPIVVAVLWENQNKGEFYLWTQLENADIGNE